MGEGLRIHLASEEDIIADAEAEIRNIMHQVAVQGSNDSELPELERIIGEVKEKKMTTEEGIRQAREIMDRKTGYR